MNELNLAIVILPVYVASLEEDVGDRLLSRPLSDLLRSAMKFCNRYSKAACACLLAILFIFFLGQDSVSVTVDLLYIDPGVTAYSGYRWRDVAGNLYSDTYRNNYGYDQPGVQVQVTFNQLVATFHGSLAAVSLKPNFAYQLKLVGYSDDPSNESIGFAGRWWQEEWNGSEWTNGQNLNDKGDGSSPNPNDSVYLSRRDILDPTSPTGKKYRYTAYLVFDYFITDENGDASLGFEANSSYHVLWNTQQRTRTGSDGPPKTTTFDPDTSQVAYSTDYPESTMTVFGEWERLPVGGVFLANGSYDCQIMLTEESFHGWPGGDYTGGWAAAMGTGIQFVIDSSVPVKLSTFGAEAEGGSAVVKWATESEVNNLGFEVFRAIEEDGEYVLVSSYKTDNSLKGQGSSNTRSEYRCEDGTVKPGQTYFYKLADVDFEGIKTFHGPVSVTIPVMPKTFRLYQNYPNPFNPITEIHYQLPEASHVELAVYDILGRKAGVLVDEIMEEGYWSVKWDGSDFASGIYFVRMEAGDFIEARRIVLMR